MEPTNLSTPLGDRLIAPLANIEEVTRLPYSIRVLLEAAMRRRDNVLVHADDVERIIRYHPTSQEDAEIPFIPGRVVLQDFTGVPAVVDLAAMRAAIVRMTNDPAAAARVNPGVPCDLVVDHSVQVDAFARPDALLINSRKEFERNQERYEFLKWGQSAFANFRVVPPATGIVHQVNLEYLAKVVWDDGQWLYPDSLVGTDSHTTMINGLGVVGWGVGGIEAEAAMLGQPISMLLPAVVGFRLTGRLREGSTATDLVLRVTEMLRQHGVVGKFVEFYGPGLDDMPVANRATIANMAPEYGATIGFFPVDQQTIEYLRFTGRPEELVETVEAYYRHQLLWRDDRHPVAYSSHLELDLASVEPALAGPRRPQDRVDLSAMKASWRGNFAPLYGREDSKSVPVSGATGSYQLSDGDVVISAITSCTNTSNPEVMMAAGLVARAAREKGLTRKPWVKTSLAPGSQVVTEYLQSAGLLADLEAAGFYLVGYGCTTCIGNSGPLPEEISQAVNDHGLVVAAVLSGNRNFEGRISPDVRANYLASPPLVVAYALAGTVDWDPLTEPIPGSEIFLRDLWPSQEEVVRMVAEHVTRSQFADRYADVFTGSEEWRSIETSGGALYSWNPESTYIQEPPFFLGLTSEVPALGSIENARVLVKVGDSVTTDHISPAGSIKPDSPAGRYLIDRGVQPAMFNSYGSRRGNDRVMTRGTFANVRVRNDLAPGTEGGLTTDFLDGTIKPIYDAAIHYQAAGVPLLVLAGKDYGMGSSRDWAAKGTFLLGVKAVLAESFERIHRSNLVMMGVLPLEYRLGENAASYGLDGHEVFSISVPDDLRPRQELVVRAVKPDGGEVPLTVIARVDTPIEVEYLRHGGILHYVLRQMAG
ncbi:MAG TPA: aconitate hydratase AcnA [Acidimicrobiia bacterium]|nr:aconitate hydratase AcnA [Acidimicrobiia bacterium]